ncbi:MAG TPA: penicillin-binding protein 2 [Gammaproteobacteria bacterium]|nr:penicillin-binding protein 2 [Gammaproteobacteria bacterium]
MARIRIRNEWQERHRFTLRVMTVAVIAMLLLVAVAVRLFYLQVISHRHFVTLAEGNRLRDEPVTPPRGLIYDRNGVLLAENLPSYELDIVPEQIADMHATLEALGKLISIRPADLKRFRDLLSTRRPFQPLPLRSNLSQEEVARFAVDRQNFPGVDISASLTRHYPLGAETAHVVGYVGAISAAELARFDPDQYSNISQVGKIGIEGAYEAVLHGSVGLRQVETNAEGRALRTVSYTPPVPGSNLYLSIDVRLQRVAQQALADLDDNGAIIAINPQNGEVLALVSEPAYDPNQFVGGIDPALYDKLNNDAAQPLFNRVLRGQYPPGSTIKPFLGLAALNYGVMKPFENLMCPGYLLLPSNPNPYRDWKRGGHGEVDLSQAITESCDVYFYTVAMKLGINRLHDYLVDFGFGEPTGIDLMGEQNGIVPSPAWKRKHLHLPWYLGETVISGIGQGYTLATPVQLADATAALGMRGRRYVPHVLHAIGDPLSGVVSDVTPQADPVVPETDPRAWDIVIKAMRDVVASPRGTAHRISFGAKYSIAGKTGTAQVYHKRLGVFGEEDESDIPKPLRDHALFIAFAPVDNPRIAVAVVVEHGGGGGVVSAPIARKLMDAYFAENPAPEPASTQAAAP